LLFVALVAISFSNAFEFSQLSEVKALRSSSYGHNLIETISLSLAKGGNIEEITNLLNDLFLGLQKDQAKAKENWNKKKKRLEDAIEDLKNDIADLKTKISANKVLQKDNEKKRDQAIKNLLQFNKQLNASKAAKKKNEDNRKADSEAFEKSTEEHNAVIDAIDAVITELKKLIGSVSGNDKPEHVEQIEAEKRDAAYNAAKSFVQISGETIDASVFAQLATSADQEALAKLISMLGDIKAKTTESLENDQEHETASKNAYEALKATLSEDIKSLEGNIKTQEENLKTYKSEIARLITLIAQQEELKKKKEESLEKTIAEKKMKAEQYATNKEEREGEMAVITKLKSIVKDRLEKMSQFLKSNVN
jgi:hypothetical protein